VFVNKYTPEQILRWLRNDGRPSNPTHLLGGFPTLFEILMGRADSKQTDIPYKTHAKWTNIQGFPQRHSISLSSCQCMSKKRNLPIFGPTNEASAIHKTNKSDINLKTSRSNKGK
jgi:hypothetical protein